jgi:hypothetical protein
MARGPHDEALWPTAARRPTIGSETVARNGATSNRRGDVMDRFITTLIDWTVVPVTNVIVFAVERGIAFIVFAGLWLAFGAALIWSQGSLDAAWQWFRDLPLIAQALAGLLLLPAVAALWVWETTWPIVLRLIVVAGLAGWSLLIFVPRAAQVARP